MFTTQRLIVIALCAALNFSIGSIVYLTKLPVYFDSVGTILCALLIWPDRKAAFVCCLTCALTSTLFTGLLVNPFLPWFVGTDLVICLCSAFLIAGFGDTFRARPMQLHAVALAGAVAGWGEGTAGTRRRRWTQCCLLASDTPERSAKSAISIMLTRVPRRRALPTGPGHLCRVCFLRQAQSSSKVLTCVSKRFHKSTKVPAPRCVDAFDGTPSFKPVKRSRWSNERPGRVIGANDNVYCRCCCDARRPAQGG